MGAEQVFRDPGLIVSGRSAATCKNGGAVGIALLLLLWTSGVTQAQTPEPGAQSSKPAVRRSAVSVLLLDVRSDAASSAQRAASREAVLADIDRSPDMVSHADGNAELTAALAGQLRAPLDTAKNAAAASVAAAATAFGQLDCPAADTAAAQAIEVLAGLAAQAPDDKTISGHLQRAHVYQLLCAHNRGDGDGAMRARFLLERLDPRGAAAGPPAGVSDLVWNLYPPLDATVNAPIHEIEVSSEPAGASVWVDYARVGTTASTPVKVLLPYGRHIVAAARDKRHRAVVLDVERDGQAVVLALSEAPAESQYLAISQRVAEWQRGAGEPTGPEIGALLRKVGVQVALVLTTGPTGASGTGKHGDMIAVFVLPPDEQVASPLVAERATRVADIGQAVRIRSLGWRQTGPEPDVALLREPRNGPTGRRDSSKRPKWWVYATIIGAVAAGATLFLANDLADNRQRIELTW